MDQLVLEKAAHLNTGQGKGSMRWACYNRWNYVRWTFLDCDLCNNLTLYDINRKLGLYFRKKDTFSEIWFLTYCYIVNNKFFKKFSLFCKSLPTMILSPSITSDKLHYCSCQISMVKSSHQKCFIKKLQAFRHSFLLKRGSKIGVFQWILRYFQEHLFWRTSANGCFFMVSWTALSGYFERTCRKDKNDTRI